MVSKMDVEDEVKKVKQNQEEYFRLITSGHCAICLCELALPQEMIELLDTATCTECNKLGFDSIFQRGILVGRELKEWKKKREVE